MKEMGRRGRNHNQLLDNINEKRFWKLKEEAIDQNLWKKKKKKSNGLDLRQTN
jgi:hypothetical protein